MFSMTDVQLGPREAIRESIWAVCEAARVLCAKGQDLPGEQKDELLRIMLAQSERLTSSLQMALGEES